MGQSTKLVDLIYLVILSAAPSLVGRTEGLSLVGQILIPEPERDGAKGKDLRVTDKPDTKSIWRE